MKYRNKSWRENTGYGHSAAVCSRATEKADELNQILWKLTCCYDQADQGTERSFFQMDKAKGPLAAILRDLNRLVEEADGFLKTQSQSRIEKAEVEWEAKRRAD